MAKKSTLLASLAFLLIGLTSAARAQEDAWLYGLNLGGKVTANSVILENLGGNGSTAQTWADLAIQGADRYVLRRDGRIVMNGVTIAELPGSVLSTEFWVSLQVDGDSVWSLNEDGMLGRNDEVFETLPTDDFFFTDSIIRAGTHYSLRADGTIFRQGETIPIFRFSGGEGVSGAGDGEATDTTWISITFDPVQGFLYALRADGTVYRTTVKGMFGTLVERLPFPSTGPLRTRDYYADIEFTDDGSWYVLRANGEVYNAASPLSPVVDYPGDANNSNETYTDLETSGTTYLAVRGDGRVYANDSTEQIVQLDPGDFHVKLAVGNEAPDLENARNVKPVATIFKTTTVVGTPLTVPIVVTDQNEAEEDLLISVQEQPVGSTYDPQTRTLTWNNPSAKGNANFKFQVDDGFNKPKKFTYKLKIKDPNPKPDKNKKPFVAKVTKGQAIVGIEYSFPLIADDPDGDDLIISYDAKAYPFSAGAIFDDATRTFIWTPTVSDIGKTKIQFNVEDGSNKPVKRKIKINVINSLTVEPIVLE